jgi:hypothetical protein
MPPCGCRTGCEHRRNPQFPAQRECRAGIVPDPLPAKWSRALTLTPEQVARARWGQWRHLRRVPGEFEC